MSHQLFEEQSELSEEQGWVEALFHVKQGQVGGSEVSRETSMRGASV